MEDDSGIAFFRGLVFALLLALPFWVLFFAGYYFVLEILK